MSARRFARIGVLLLSACLALSVPAWAQQAAVTLKPGEAAPAFALPDLHGETVKLSDLRGGAVLLNFWAFWCDTWKEEMPALKELAARQKDLHFRMAAISVDGTRLSELKSHAGSPPFPVLLDIGGRVTSAYGVAHVPTVVVLDSHGRLVFSCVGWPGNQPILNRLRKLASQN